MVFCFQIVLTFCEKKKLVKFEAKDHKYNLFEQCKVRIIFEIECFFNLLLEVSQI